VHIGLGLPISDPDMLLEWARRADAGPFSTLGLLDRLVYDNPEPLVTLAAIAGATDRIRLQTEVLLAPLREPTLLAKQAATLDRLSGGRFTLGLGIGTRADDYGAAGADFHSRGRRLDEQVAAMRGIWAGQQPTVGPSPARRGGPAVLFGGFAPAAVARVARWGDGFLCAAAAEFARSLFQTVEREWSEAGRSGRPRLVAQVNVAVGPGQAVDQARDTIAAYYGPGEFTDHVLSQLRTTPAQIRAAMSEFAELGADELMLYCWSADPSQVDRLADSVS
jgi:alkanesulfonate monooxygenase SsuD/methylene tetrahydromethanopterin reductase-like flavin-dependent oxidoreductase (luciferase family)